MTHDSLSTARFLRRKVLSISSTEYIGMKGDIRTGITRSHLPPSVQNLPPNRPPKKYSMRPKIYATDHDNDLYRALTTCISTRKPKKARPVHVVFSNEFCQLAFRFGRFLALIAFLSVPLNPIKTPKSSPRHNHA